MTTIFDIRPQEIEGLNERTFVEVMNHLLWAEGNSLGIPPSDIQTSYRIHDPDGGIDAKITALSDIQEVWIPAGESVWSFKSSKISPSDLKKELEKNGVQEALARGAIYCLVIGKDLVSESSDKLAECLKEQRIRHKIYNASHVAKWASKVPSVRLSPYFQHLGELKNFDCWAGSVRRELPFVPDKERESIIANLRDKLTNSSESLHIRVEGHPGVGKTRLVHEALNKSGIKEFVAYAREPECIPGQFFEWLRKEDAYERVILVVDECDPNEVEKFEREVNLCTGRVKLITIGHQFPSEALPSNMYRLAPLDKETIEKIISGGDPSIPKETARFVASYSSGYVKLAELLVKTLKENPSLRSSVQLAKSYEIKLLLLKLFLPDEAQRRALKAIAILSRVGWENELSKEGETVAKFIGVSWKELQDTAGEMVRQGVVVKKGRYRFITPHLLAVLLASEVWEDRGESTLDLLGQLPTTLSQEAFLERLEDLAGHESIKQTIERQKIFDTYFPDFSCIDNEPNSKIFEKLTICHPEAGLRALQRLLLPVSLEELTSFKNGRRHVVWTLEKLAWLPETFEGASRLLLKLAAAENENYANNAPGIWCQLFSTFLPGTSVPVLDRLRLVEEALRSEQLKYKLLGVKAIGSAMSTGSFYRSVSGELQGGRVVPPEYFPRTSAELRQVITSALQLWDKAFSDGNEAVSDASVKALLGKTRGLILSGFHEEVMQRIERFLFLKNDKEHLSWEVRQTLQGVLEYEGKHLKEDQFKRIERLIEEFAGNAYKEKLRRWIGRLTFQDSDFKGNKHAEMAMSLAEEGYKNPDILKPEIEWLTSKEAENIWPFGKRLGELDYDRKWLGCIEPFAREGHGQLFLAAYFFGRKSVEDEEWVDSKIDAYIASDRLMATAVLKMIQTSAPSPAGVKKLVVLVDKGWLEPVSLGALAWGEWTEKLTREPFCELLNTLCKDEGEQASLIALQMLDNRLRHVKEDLQELKGLVFGVMARPSAMYGEIHMLDWCWAEVAKRYLDLEPIKLAKIAVQVLLSKKFSNDYALAVLIEASKLKPKEILWDVVGPVLLKENKEGYKLLFRLGGLSGFDKSLEFNDFAGLVGKDVAIEWAEKNQPQGPRILASVTHIADEKGLTPVAKELIVKFGEDKKVISALECRFFSGTWMGDESSHLKSKLDTAIIISQDPNPMVKEWGKKLVEGLKVDIERAKLKEEEEKY